MVDPNNQDTLNEALELFHFAFRAFTTGPDAILAEQGLQRVHHRILYFVVQTRLSRECFYCGFWA